MHLLQSLLTSNNIEGPITHVDNFLASMANNSALMLQISNLTSNFGCLLSIFLRGVHSFVGGLERFSSCFVVPAFLSLVGCSLQTWVFCLIRNLTSIQLARWILLFFLLLFLLLWIFLLGAWLRLVLFSWLISIILLFLFQDKSFCVSVLFFYQHLRLW